MGDLKQLAEIDWWYVIIAICLFLICLKFIWSLLDWLLFEKLGIETKKMKLRREEHELLVNTAKGLNELQQRHISDNEECIKHDGEIKSDLKKLTNMFLESEIDSMRYKILDFASSISSGKKVNRESYDYILKIYSKYEKILEENNMENGLVEESIKYIQNSYQKYLKDGDINYQN